MQKTWRMKLGAVLLGLLLTAGFVETVLLGVGAAAAIGTYKWIEGTMPACGPAQQHHHRQGALRPHGQYGLLRLFPPPHHAASGHTA